MGLSTCKKCGGEIKPAGDIFKKSPGYQNFKKELDELGIPEPKYFNCTGCGQIYDENMNKTDLKLTWLNH